MSAPGLKQGPTTLAWRGLRVLLRRRVGVVLSLRPGVGSYNTAPIGTNVLLREARLAATEAMRAPGDASNGIICGSACAENRALCSRLSKASKDVNVLTGLPEISLLTERRIREVGALKARPVEAHLPRERRLVEADMRRERRLTKSASVRRSRCKFALCGSPSLRASTRKRNKEPG